MPWSAEETLEYVQPHLPSNLVPLVIVERVQKLLRQLPDTMSSFYFECRLSGADPQVDFLMSMQAAHREHFVAGMQEGVRQMDAAMWNVVWEKAYNFCEEWNLPTSPLHEHIEHIWFEFDGFNRLGQSVPQPSVCFCLDQSYLHTDAGSLSDQRPDLKTQRLVTQTALPLLLDNPDAHEVICALSGCYSQLPIGGSLIHISVMLARQPVVAKVYGQVPRAHLTDYLNRIGWSGSQTDLDTLLQAYYGTYDPVFFDLTINGPTTSRIGLAFSQIHQRRVPKQIAGWEQLLATCIANGVCAGEMRRTLLSWPGSERVTFLGQKWPTRLHRWLDIKLVLQPGHPLEAKAYLGYMPLFSLF